ALLQRVVAVAGEVIREHDVFGRLGGDEFGVLLPHSGEDAATRLAERLVEQMKTTPPPGGITIQPTLSIGVAALAGADMSVPELIKAADSAMYRAKRGGRNRIVRASDAR
ncbi:MAG: diguanylate cyclase, partial [Spirochaetes bacterium]|nr:diguanylate cyclase [Spirochaetota bacterium]